MKVKKLIMIFLSIVLITVGGNGCMFGESTTKMMVKHMNEKYDDKFEYLEPFGGGPGAESKQILVTSEKMPGAEIWVLYSREDGKDVFYDNYVYFKYKEEINELLKAILRDLLDHEFIYRPATSERTLAEGLNDETTFKEYISSTETGIGFVVIVAPGYNIGSRDDLINKVNRAFINNGVFIAGADFYFMSNKEEYNNLEELYTMQYLAAHREIPCLTFKMGKDKSVSESYWR